MLVSKKHFKKLTKKSLFLPTEKRNRSCSSATKKRIIDQTTFDVTSL